MIVYEAYAHRDVLSPSGLLIHHPERGDDAAKHLDKFSYTVFANPDKHELEECGMSLYKKLSEWSGKGLIKVISRGSDSGA